MVFADKTLTELLSLQYCIPDYRLLRPQLLLAQHLKAGESSWADGWMGGGGRIILLLLTRQSFIAHLGTAAAFEAYI